MERTIRLEIPNYLPPTTVLSLNARVHWRKKYDAQVDQRQLVIAALHKQKIWLYDSLRVSSTTLDGSSGVGVLTEPFPWEKIAVKFSFYVKDNRRRDKDNFIASMKTGLDALQGRIIKDDKDIVLFEAEFIKNKALTPMTVMEVKRI